MYCSIMSISVNNLFGDYRKLILCDVLSGNNIETINCYFDKPLIEYKRGDIIPTLDSSDEYHVLSLIPVDNSIILLVSKYPFEMDYKGFNITEMILNRFVIATNKNHPYYTDRDSRYVVILATTIPSNSCKIARYLGDTNSGDMVWVDEDGNLIADEVIAYRIL